jgi:hypothetical protein
MIAFRTLSASLLALALAADTPLSALAPHLRSLLSDALKFSPGELADLQRGKIVRHRLDVSAPSEVAAVGAVRIAADRDVFVDAYRDIVRFKRGPEVLQIGRFSNPPVLSDLDGLTVTKDDADLRGCRVHDCDIRLPASAIARVQQEIDWRAADADARAAALFKQLLFDHVHAYATGQSGRIAQYDDEEQPVMRMKDFQGLLDASPVIGTLVPGLDAHLRDYPHSPLAGAEDLLYWSKEKFGLTPFITVTHVTITHDSQGDYVMTSNDVYSSRYFDASLTLSVASNAADGNGFFLVYMNRSRASALKGAFAGLRRSIVERRARGSIEENLRSLKLRLEKGTAGR